MDDPSNNDLNILGDCQKAWWCEGGKLQTDVCTPKVVGTERCNHLLYVFK